MAIWQSKSNLHDCLSEISQMHSKIGYLIGSAYAVAADMHCGWMS